MRGTLRRPATEGRRHPGCLGGPAVVLLLLAMAVLLGRAATWVVGRTP